jgi:uncharacterized protein (TIGR03000 family)
MTHKLLFTLTVVLMSVGSVKAQPSFPQGNGSISGSTPWEYGYAYTPGYESSSLNYYDYMPQDTSRGMYARWWYAPQYYYSAAPAFYTYESGYYGTRPEYVVPDDAALINLTVPANAEVWFSGNKTASTGAERSFVTPQLERGRRFAYDVRVRWMENGKTMEKVQKVPVQAGSRLNLSIN